MNRVYSSDGQLIEATVVIRIYHNCQLIHREKTRLKLEKWDHTTLWDKIELYLRKVEETFKGNWSLESECEVLGTDNFARKQEKCQYVSVSWTGRPELDELNFQD